MSLPAPAQRLAMPWHLLLLLLSLMVAPSWAATTVACPGNCLHVDSIDIGAANLAHGLTRLTAKVRVLDQNGGANAARGAVVHGVWTRPNGVSFDQYAVIGNRLEASFRLHTTGDFGQYSFRVIDVRKSGYGFDPAASLQTAVSYDLIDPNNVLPVAVPNADATSGVAPLTVNFDGSGSNDPDGQVVAWHWDFGDGSAADSDIATHTYTTPGVYDALLTVTDDQGGATSQRIAITVTADVVPCTTNCLHVESIGMSAYRPRWAPQRGWVRARVRVRNELDRAVRGVTVHCIWTLPDGSEVEDSAPISANGWKWFAESRVPAPQAGTYQLRITDITGDGYRFDAESSSMLSVSVSVGN